MPQQDKATTTVDNAVAEGGAYEVIRKRLLKQGKQLSASVQKLNTARLQEFGSSEMKVAARVRVRTENNCVARDIVQVGDALLFGYNVFIGLKKETRISDVFALFSASHTDDGYQIEPLPLQDSFLAEKDFVRDFDELYRYYKHTRLVQLTVKDSKLLAGFQIGERLEDIRVFRWSVSADGSQIKYIDNRGERDIQLPPAYDFEWIETSRENQVGGSHPHVSILDKVFVETVGGDLTIKVENNTRDGLGIYREAVEDKTQSLDDADIHYAEIGALILLKIRPYREQQWRYLIFNSETRQVLRMDAIGSSCVQLPEDHGIIFPGGYYLQNGEYKTYDGRAEGLHFKCAIRSPNGEDFLYIFYAPASGQVSLLAYNLIDKSLQNPIRGNGYALSRAGRLIIFSSQDEPTRIHPMQIWETPYVSDEYASQAPASQSFLGRIGNAELVRGISDLYSLCRLIEEQEVSVQRYNALSKMARTMFDSHYWVEDESLAPTAERLRDISATAELVIDEFEKVESIRQQSFKAIQQAERDQQDILRSIQPDSWTTAEDFVNALNQLRHQRGHLVTLNDYRYIDLPRIGELDDELAGAQNRLGMSTVEFLAGEKALVPYLHKIDQLDKERQQADTVAQLQPIIDTVENMASGLDMLSELMATLKVEDATVRTRIIDAISEVYAKLNQSRARAANKKKGLGSEEASAQFSAQFKLFSQSINNALGMATTPQRCDEQLSRLLVQLEELESQFSDYEQFLSDIMAQRDEVYETFEGHKQQLLDDRQRKAQAVNDAATRILASIERRSLQFTQADELNTYFASDALVLKVRELVERLRELESNVQADDIESRFKAGKEQALRSLRDKSDIFEDGGQVIKLGPRHRFSVNTRELDLTIIPRDDSLSIHLTGTKFYAPVQNPELESLRPYWDLSLDSETPELYRGEYLAAELLRAVENGEHELTMQALRQAATSMETLLPVVRRFAAPRYREGYSKGIHDHDASLILMQLLAALERADLLRFDPLCRGLAQIFWANLQAPQVQQSFQFKHESWRLRAQSAQQMQQIFVNDTATRLLVEEIQSALRQFIKLHPIAVSELDMERASSYLVAELSRESCRFIGSRYAAQLVEELKNSLDNSSWRQYQESLDKLSGQVADRWNLTQAWLQALIESRSLQALQRYIPEAIGLLNADERIERRATEVDVELQVSGLLGEHPLIEKQSLSFALDTFLQRMQQQRTVTLPAYHRYLQIRQQVMAEEKQALRLDEFRARPLSSFVRNRLINDAYLPVIGDNLAKQMGTVGENRRTDLMGLLMMISPPGYGKTTLMEYVANRLGLIFMKINCPALGHDVLSLDPAQAPNATAKQELVKLNLALEMGNNVMLYLDDIQHTHAEFLQKFISLCDGTRRIEGVWKGRSKTYDMRGRKFCVVMAGNPYTESGEAFKVPDMLANRADIYNLGDILGGMDEQFASSYIENALTSNPVLEPLALREMEDVYKLMEMARGRNIASTDLSHQYSGAEINEISRVLKKLFQVQKIVLAVNQQYIVSAAQNDRYRTEPVFKLQGSYRNMNKMAEKVSAVMNDEELMQMISDHYLGEAQLLTSGAEENLLKLAELRGNQTDEEKQRWHKILDDYRRNQAMGGDEADTGNKLVGQLLSINDNLSQMGQQLKQGFVDDADSATQLQGKLQAINDSLSQLAPLLEQGFKSDNDERKQEQLVEALGQIAHGLSDFSYQVEVINEPVPGIDKLLTAIADVFEKSIHPLILSMDGKLSIDLRTQENIGEVAEALRDLRGEMRTITRSDGHLMSDAVLDNKPVIASKKHSTKKRPSRKKAVKK